MAIARRPLVIGTGGDVHQLQIGEGLVDGFGNPVGGSLNARLTFAITQSSLATADRVKTYSAEGALTFDIMKVVSNLAFPVRLRIYSSATFRDADAPRSRYSGPPPGAQHGVIMDLILTVATGFTWVMSPIARGECGDGTGNIYYTVDNLDIVARNIDLVVTYLKGE